MRRGGGERVGERGRVWRAGLAELEELQKRGGGRTGFMQMDADDGAERARLGLSLHKPFGGRLWPP